MEDFRKTNLIIKFDENVYQLDSLIELTNLVFGEDYSKIEEDKKTFKRYNLVLPLSIKEKLPIVYLNKGVVKAEMIYDNTEDFDINHCILIDNDYTYFLSLCRLNQIQILEKKDANIFTSKIDKSNMESNYILVNKFADKLLETYFNESVFYG